jgi:hypothetical protein
MNYCIDCEHFMQDAKKPERGPICMRFKRDFIVSEDPVTGARWDYSAPDCKTARGEGGQCGAQARFFEARPGTAPWVAQRERERVKVFDEAAEELAPLRRPWWRFW